MTWLILGAVVGLILLVLAVIDVVQRKHAIRRNFPLVGRLRYLLERLGPELRQYIVTDNDEERPFSRDQRRWVYATAKKENQYFGFGTDNKMDDPQYAIVRHTAFPYQPDGGDRNNVPTDSASTDPSYLPVAKVMGEWRDREKAFRPNSVVNISAMSFGSLSARAVTALNKGAALAGCLHNTGEGGISDHHGHGGDLVFQFGTGYFGVRSPDGKFSLDQAIAQVQSRPVRAIEVKLSQGAKPGLGGVLPGSKVTAEIAAARGVEVGKTVNSPAFHTSFDSIATMIDFVELVAAETGVPVGIKSAVGDRRFWTELADEMQSTQRGPDFIAIDGGEGGTGAAPLAFSDHVSLPFRLGFAEVYRTFAQRGLHDKVVWVGSGKLGFPTEALVAMGLGVDVINVAREAMLAVGCIQAQECHTGHCPTGVATHSTWLTRGLDPTDKSVRTANYIKNLRYELLQLAHACGYSHPALVGGQSIDLMTDGDRLEPMWDRFNYENQWMERSKPQVQAIDQLMA